VILSGMSSRPGGFQGGVEVLWPREGGCAFKLRKDIQTGDFDTAKPIDEQMDYHERIRLLYVACTRARDHLIVSLHRKERQTPADADSSWTNAELLAGACDGAPSQMALDAVAGGSGSSSGSRSATEPPGWEDWLRDITRMRERAARPAAMSASQLEGSSLTGALRPTATDRVGEPADAGLAKDGRDLELPPWNKGRYGTAIGSAVHGVLQTVDLATGQGLEDAVAAQVLAEGVAEHDGIVGQLVRAALGSAAVRRAAVCPHWRETYVGTVVGERVLEGFIDLIYRDDGLVIVDYKTDSVPAVALDRRVAFYRPQMAAYAAALQAATQELVTRCVLVFLSPGGAVERTVESIQEAAALVQDAVRSE